MFFALFRNTSKRGSGRSSSKIDATSSVRAMPSRRRVVAVNKGHNTKVLVVNNAFVSSLYTPEKRGFGEEMGLAGEFCRSSESFRPTRGEEGKKKKKLAA